jgi:hypothetical protein
MHRNKRIFNFIILAFGLLVLAGLLFASKCSKSPDTASNDRTPFTSLSFGSASSDYDAFLSMRLHAPLSTTLPDIKLYTDETDGSYFFLPACADLSDYVFSLENGGCEILIDGEPIRNRGSLEQYELDTPYPVTLRTADGTTQSTLTFMRSENLPAVFISTASGSIDDLNASKENKEHGNFVCLTADGQIDSSGSLSSVKAHGNSSFTMVNKKSFQITFDNATDVLSMGAAGKYILQANAFDDTFLRNKTAYDYCKELGIAYAVDAEYVDLYFNGEYAGNYLLTEKVEIGKNRVDLTGGYLMEQLLSERIEEDDQVFGVNGLHDFLIKNSSPLSEKELQSLSDYMNTVETMIQDCDSDEKYAALQEYIDINSFVDMYLINAITNDIDSNIASTFYYKKEDGNDGKLYAGPAWDYDNAWGRMDNKPGYELNAYPTGLCEELFLSARFREAVTAKYNDVAYPLMQDYLAAKIPQYLEQIASSIAMDSARWQSDGYHSYYYTDYESAVSYLETYIGNRMDYLYNWLNHPEEYRRVLFVNAKSNPKYRDTEYMIKDGEQIPDEVLTEILSRFEGSDFQNEDGSPFAPETAILDDITLYVN